MQPQDWTESTWEPINYKKFINQFPPDTIKLMRPLERMNTKTSRQMMSLWFNIYIYIYMCVCVCRCV